MWDLDLINKAVIFASKKHNGQMMMYPNDAPYSAHYFGVTINAIDLARLCDFEVDWELLICSSILHDTIEDTSATFEEVKENFGEKIANGVFALTKNSSLEKKEQMKDSLERIKQQPKEIATAVRKPDGEIALDKRAVSSLVTKYHVNKIPVVRGVFSFFESLYMGVSCLMYSASFLVDEEENPEKMSKFEKWILDKCGDKLLTYVMYLSVLLSLVIGIGLFMLLPNYLVGFLKNAFPNISIPVLNLSEGAVRLLFFVLYLYLVSKMEDINLMDTPWIPYNKGGDARKNNVGAIIDRPHTCVVLKMQRRGKTTNPPYSCVLILLYFY